MKNALIIFIFSLVAHLGYSQSVKELVEGKYFNNQQTGRSIKYGYISSLNTYGVTFKDREGNLANFMNCSIDISRDEQYMVLTFCMSPISGGTLGKIVVYKDRLIWNGDDGSLTFYIENGGSVVDNNIPIQKHEFSSLIEGGGKYIAPPKKEVVITALEVKRIIGKPKKIGNLEIAQFDFSKVMNYDDAISACEQLGKGWRLPTKDELIVIYKNRAMIGGFIKGAQEYGNFTTIHYSCTRDLERKDRVWMKEFKENGYEGYDDDVFQFVVRAVRTL